MATAAPIRSKANVITEISARSRKPTTVEISMLPRLFAREHRGLAGFDDVLRTAHRMRRIGRDDLASHQPVEQHADGGQVLLDRRLLKILAERLDIGGDTQRLDTRLRSGDGLGWGPLRKLWRR